MQADSHVYADDSPSWEDMLRRVEDGGTVAVIAHGEHVAYVVPPGELDRLRETLEVLSDTKLVQGLIEDLADFRAGWARHPACGGADGQ